MQRVNPIKTVTRLLWRRATSTSDYWLTRFVLLRVLGFVYFFAFLSLATQVLPLIGENGLLPADNYLENVNSGFSTTADAFKTLPTIFWINDSDAFLQSMAWVGVIISFVIMLGFANVPIMLFNWFLYMSFVHVGQLWYGYGWETQLLETGFLAMFLVPLLDARPFPKHPPPAPIIWLFRWLAFRINLGAGLIKVRTDACWKDLTCLFYHYETQPIPNPLSPFFHALPEFIDRLGVATTHIVQIVMPFLIFTWRNSRTFAGVALLLFQILLIFTGNYSFLNWITIVPIIALFDDKFLAKFLPKWIVKRASNAAKRSKPSNFGKVAVFVMVVTVIWLSIPVVLNLMASNQAMNTSFNQLHLVNTYGAFGSITKVRHELVMQGTDELVLTEQTKWREYEFKAKPTNVSRQPVIIAPYQPRIDWQLWFAAFQRPEQNPWIPHLMWKLLHNDDGVLSLIEHNPFPDKPPEFIRIEFYRYHMLPPGSEDVWKRERIGTYMQPLSIETPGLREFIVANKWNTYD